MLTFGAKLATLSVSDHSDLQAATRNVEAEGTITWHVAQRDPRVLSQVTTVRADDSDRRLSTIPRVLVSLLRARRLQRCAQRAEKDELSVVRNHGGMCGTSRLLHARVQGNVIGGGRIGHARVRRQHDIAERCECRNEPSRTYGYRIESDDLGNRGLGLAIGDGRRLGTRAKHVWQLPRRTHVARRVLGAHCRLHA